jgi:hypothetical protein
VARRQGGLAVAAEAVQADNPWGKPLFRGPVGVRLEQQALDRPHLIRALDETVWQVSGYEQERPYTAEEVRLPVGRREAIQGLFQALQPDCVNCA